MTIRELALPDLFLIQSKGFEDSRGLFFESFEQTCFTEALGHPFTVAQTNFSVSHRNTLRGIHGVLGPAGQAKLVTCVRGSVLDIVVDLRAGSPTFGRHVARRLSPATRTSLYIGEGLGHSFLALEEDTCMHYCCSTAYVPEDVFTVNALDAELALPWPLAERPIMSGNDFHAPTLAEAAAQGLLPRYEHCVAMYRESTV
jgi:NDP-hexose 3,5-(Or5-) epimerase